MDQLALPLRLIDTRCKGKPRFTSCGSKCGSGPTNGAAHVGAAISTPLAKKVPIPCETGDKDSGRIEYIDVREEGRNERCVGGRAIRIAQLHQYTPGNIESVLELLLIVEIADIGSPEGLRVHDAKQARELGVVIKDWWWLSADGGDCRQYSLYALNGSAYALKGNAQTHGLLGRDSGSLTIE
jgi:hypothetical protein